MRTAVIQTRVDAALKYDADTFFESIGMDTTTAIRIFLKQTLIQHKIPFEIIQDNSFYSERNKCRWKTDNIQYMILLRYKKFTRIFQTMLGQIIHIG